MTQSISPRAQRQSSDPVTLKQDQDLERLRQLLLGKDYEELLALKAQLNDSASRSRFIADTLPAAVQLSSMENDRLTKALLQNVEDALQTSVRKNPRPLVEALFPVIGPAIRKSIAETLAELLQTINQMVEHSLSTRSLKWRFDAWRSGASYAEMVLKNTLVYQVEQVFLIDRKTGLLLNHLTSDTAITKDPDMVSAMLTAIQDFVTDSFQVNEQENLHQMRFGDLTVLIEPGPRALLAIAIRGNPPDDIRQIVAETLEQIHLIHSEALQAYDGDNKQLATTSHQLENCLISQAESKHERRTSPLTWLLILSVLLFLGYWLYGVYDKQAQWNTALERLYQEPGLAIMSTDKEQGQYIVRGLRDELARDPAQVVSPATAEALGIEWQFQPYIALAPELIKLRAERLLQPPKNILMLIEGNRLILSGEAPQQWIADVKDRALLIPGIQSVDTHDLVAEERYELVFEQQKRYLEITTLLFEYGESSLSGPQADRIPELASIIQQLQDTAAAMEGLLTITVIGHSDSHGTVQAHDKISLARAESVKEALIAEGLKPSLFSVIGMGSRELITGTQSEDKQELNRRVTFRVEPGYRPDSVE
jgi:OOP family OmpA-OmpF porin